MTREIRPDNIYTPVAYPKLGHDNVTQKNIVEVVNRTVDGKINSRGEVELQEGVTRIDNAYTHPRSVVLFFPLDGGAAAAFAGNMYVSERRNGYFEVTLTTNGGRFMYVVLG